eukprot:2960588-Prymnesium_polylepis.2
MTRHAWATRRTLRHNGEHCVWPAASPATSASQYARSNGVRGLSISSSKPVGCTFSSQLSAPCECCGMEPKRHSTCIRGSRWIPSHNIWGGRRGERGDVGAEAPCNGRGDGRGDSICDGRGVRGERTF